MIVFLYAFHDCDYNRSVPQNRASIHAWQKAAACKKADLGEILSLITWLKNHKLSVAHKFSDDSCRIYYFERGPLL